MVHTLCLVSKVQAQIPLMNGAPQKHKQGPWMRYSGSNVWTVHSYAWEVNDLWCFLKWMVWTVSHIALHTCITDAVDVQHIILCAQTHRDTQRHRETRLYYYDVQINGTTVWKMRSARLRMSASTDSFLDNLFNASRASMFVLVVNKVHIVVTWRRLVFKVTVKKVSKSFKAVRNESVESEYMYCLSYIIHHTSYIIHHTSYIIHHTSYIIHHTSYIIHHTSYIIHHTSYIIQHHTSYIIHHTSYIIHHTSYIIHHTTSYIIHHTSHTHTSLAHT